MASMNVYNYYHMAMPHIANTKFDSHQKGELKSRYQDMVKLNKQKPFFKLSLSNETQSYVIGIKEAALELKNSSAFLNEDTDPAQQKMSISTDAPGDLSVTLLTKNYDALPSEMKMEVESLASKQRNSGLLLDPNGTDISEGHHTIYIDKNGEQYSFEIDTKEDETNMHIARRLAMSINNNSIGLRANLTEAGTRFRMELESSQTGAGSLEGDLQFKVYDEGSGEIASTFGLDRIDLYPKDAKFSINGDVQTSASNHISINNGIGIDLHKTTSSEATITLAPDHSTVLGDVDDFVGYYNNLIDLANKQTTNRHGARRLLREIDFVTKQYKNDLESSGLKITEDGHIEKDEALLVQSTENGNIRELFHQLTDFRDAIDNATGKITLNPMEYVDQTIVSYPNTKQTFPNPYMPSIYSGMLYNQYV